MTFPPPPPLLYSCVYIHSTPFTICSAKTTSRKIKTREAHLRVKYSSDRPAKAITVAPSQNLTALSSSFIIQFAWQIQKRCLPLSLFRNGNNGMPFPLLRWERGRRGVLEHFSTRPFTSTPFPRLLLLPSLPLMTGFRV